MIKVKVSKCPICGKKYSTKGDLCFCCSSNAGKDIVFIEKRLITLYPRRAIVLERDYAESVFSKEVIESKVIFLVKKVFIKLCRATKMYGY